MKTTERVEIPGSQGAALAARLDRPLDGLPPDGVPRAWALFAHCFTCSKDLRAARTLSRTLAQAGWGVLRFDFTGLGESEGDFADTDFASNVDDLVAAAAWLEEHHGAPALLVGHSLGGTAALLAAARLPSVRAVATIGAPFCPAHVTHLFASDRDEIEAEGRARVEIAGRRFTVTRQLLEDLEETSVRETLRRLGRALLLFHAPRDEVVGLENARLLYEAARHPKSFVSLDDADHLLTRPDDAAYVAQVLAAWARRYLPAFADDEGEGAPELRGAQVVTRTGRERYRTEITAGHHGLLADEPTSAGGRGLGPDPYGLLLAALGACTSMTLRMYADRKGWPLEAALVRLSHEKRHVADCRDCGDEGARLDHVVRRIELEGDLDEAQRDRLLAIADRCPVHKTLHSEIRVETSLEPPAGDGGG